MALALQFLGVGDARNLTLGSSSAVLERDGEPLLLIDCGPTVEGRFRERYGRLPPAVFITHVHMDHVAGLEGLFYSAWFNEAVRGLIKLYVPVGVLPALHARVASFPEPLAEGGANFYDAFQTIPVGEAFWHAALKFDAIRVRHHAPGTAFGLGLRGSFVYTGDTRPIPEALDAYPSEPVFHDLSLNGNASHSGADDLQREYSPGLIARLHTYHYRSLDEAQALRAKGFRVVEPDERFELAAAV
jgi:ribonuclease BN (tRNA processing enzyme)